MEDLPTDPLIVVHSVRPDQRPCRRVDIGHEVAGHAHSLADVLEFARRASAVRALLDVALARKWCPESARM